MDRWSSRARGRLGPAVSGSCCFDRDGATHVALRLYWLGGSSGRHRRGCIFVVYQQGEGNSHHRDHCRRQKGIVEAEERAMLDGRGSGSRRRGSQGRFHMAVSSSGKDSYDNSNAE